MNKVLLIDADRDFLYLTSRVLENNAFKVLTVTEKTSIGDVDLSDLEQLVESYRPDFILIEHRFYDAPLQQICTVIRQAYRGILIIMGENLRWLIGYRDCLADAYLLKPFNSHALMNILTLKNWGQ